MTNRLIGPLLFGGALLLAVMMPVPAAAAPVKFTCSPTKVTGSASALDSSSTTSETFVNIPETNVSFTQGGTSASCVVVTFSALLNHNANGGIIRARLGNTTAGRPAETVFNNSGAQTFTFIFPSVAPGSHTVRMQFHINGPGGTTTVMHHNTIVQFAP